MTRWSVIAVLIDFFCPNKCIGVEIGVDKGVTSDGLTGNCSKIGMLYSIDPWINRDGRYSDVAALLKDRSNCTLLRMSSTEAAKVIHDDLDFVFIDGDHEYEAVLNDLNLWFPKIKSGGLLAGHDWTHRRPGVPKACTEFFAEHKDMFEPILLNTELDDMGLGIFRVGGHMDCVQKLRLTHTYWPIWWRIKKS